MRLPVVIITLLLISCTQNKEVPTASSIGMQRSMMVQVADSVVKKTIAINPEIIERAVVLRIAALWAADSVQRKSIDSLRRIIVNHEATIKAIKQVAVIPSNQDFRIDSIKNILYIRR